MERDFEVRNGGTPHWHAAHLLALVGISFAHYLVGIITVS